MMNRTLLFRLTCASTFVICLVGCQAAKEKETAKSSEHSHSHEDGHSHEDDHSHEGAEKASDAHNHGAGPHGGTIAEWGGGSYHVEFTVDHQSKEATVFVLGDDAKKPNPIAATQILLSIQEPAFQVHLQPKPLEGEPAGSSSRFSGTHENLGIVREFSGTIGGEVDGTPYAGNFEEKGN